MAALGDTGRFAVPWMAAARAARQAATASAAAAAAGRGFENIPILDIATHVMTTEPAADVNALAKQFAYATAGVHGAAARHDVRRVKERMWNVFAASDAGAKPRFGKVAGSTGDDTERAFSATGLHASDRRRAGAGCGNRADGANGADGADHGVDVFRCRLWFR